MSEPVFSAEDFDPGIGLADDGQELCTYVWAAQIANAKIEKLLGPEVFGNEHGYWGVESDDENRDMYTARLFNVQPIEKKPCKHEAELRLNNKAEPFIYRYECIKCGTKLKWEPYER